MKTPQTLNTRMREHGAQVKRLTAILVAKEGDLRTANHAIKTLDLDMHKCQDSAEDLIKKESQNRCSIQNNEQQSIFFFWE